MHNKLHYLVIISIVASIGWLNPDNETATDNAKGEDTLRILTYNVHRCNPPGTKIVDIPAIAKVVKQSNADVVALQEIDVNTIRSGKDIHEAEEIAKACGMYVCFGKAIDFSGGAYGVAILSKYPIGAVQNQLLPKDADPKTEQRTLLIAEIKINNKKKFYFASTHLDVESEANRVLQINEIQKRANAASIPFFIGGDFNDTPNSKAMKIFDQHFQQSCQTCAPTFPQDIPTTTIDFIGFYKKQAKKIKAIRHEVLEEKYASDHRPVLAEFLVKF
jgi:endonuclease/exonuclease/phosphatase family metal-dependent hydrolase